MMGSVQGSFNFKFETETTTHYVGKQYEMIGYAETQEEALNICSEKNMYLLPLDIGSETFEDEMTEIGIILDRETGKRWGIRLWLPYQLIDGAWVPDYGGQTYNTDGLPWSHCDNGIDDHHINQPTGMPTGGQEKCLQYRIDGIKYGTDEMCVWGLYNDKCRIPKQNRYVVCSSDYSPVAVLSGNFTSLLFHKF